MYNKQDQTELVNGLKLQLEHSFGNFQMPISKNAIFVDEGNIFFIFERNNLH